MTSQLTETYTGIQIPLASGQQRTLESALTSDREVAAKWSDDTTADYRHAEFRGSIAGNTKTGVVEESGESVEFDAFRGSSTNCYAHTAVVDPNAFDKNRFAEVIESLLNAGKYEFFEDGMDTPFSIALESLIRIGGNAVVEILTEKIVCELVSNQVAAEVLRLLGRMKHAVTHRKRRWLLERALRCSSSGVRDGAILGLSSLDDPHALPYLSAALDCETHESLRQDMQQIIAEIEESR